MKNKYEYATFRGVSVGFFLDDNYPVWIGKTQIIVNYHNGRRDVRKEAGIIKFRIYDLETFDKQGLIGATNTHRKFKKDAASITHYMNYLEANGIGEMIGNTIEPFTHMKNKYMIVIESIQIGKGFENKGLEKEALTRFIERMKGFHNEKESASIFLFSPIPPKVKAKELPRFEALIEVYKELGFKVIPDVSEKEFLFIDFKLHSEE